MNRLDRALSGLAERGEPVGSHVLLDSLEHQLTGEPAQVVVALETRRRAMEITPQPTKRNPQWFKGRRGAIGAFAAAAALIVAVFAITSVINSDSDVADRGPAETIEAYIAAYNTGDLEVVMELFTEEAVITDHPFALTSVGLAAIRSVQFLDLQGAAAENPYTISNVVATGNTVTWDHVWITREGDRSCRYGHRAVVADGKILTWTWPGGGHTSCR